MTWADQIPAGDLQRSGKPIPAATEEWLADLSLDRYRPMSRLLDESDWQFLREQLGFRPELERSLRRQRVQLFRAYLRMLEADFQRLCGALDGTMPDADAVAQRKVDFAWQMMVVRSRLRLFEWGIGRADAGRLLDLFAETRADAASFARL